MRYSIYSLEIERHNHPYKMLQNVCLVLLIVVGFANLDTITSAYHVHRHMRVPDPSLNMSSSFIDTDPIRASSDESNYMSHYARYRVNSPPAGGYTGGMATLDVYNFPNLKSGVLTAAIMWVSNGKLGHSDLNEIQAGWMVDPSHYGDSKTRFFVYWTADKYKSTGCFNLDCNGFVPVNGAPITPGDTLQPEIGQSKISFKIFKNKDDGDWWLHFGYDINNMHPAGFWPKSLFSNLEDHASMITWGGFTARRKGNASPPMGNGQWPGKNSASFRNVQLVDKNGQGYTYPAWTFRVYASHKKCYQASTFFDNMFYYGGPGGCTN